MENNKKVASISALKQYIEKRKQNIGWHAANIIIHINKKDYGPGTRVVYVSVEKNHGEVIIENLETLCGNCPNTFTTLNSDFSFRSGTLCIKNLTTLLDEIIVNIT